MILHVIKVCTVSRTKSVRLQMKHLMAAVEESKIISLLSSNMCQSVYNITINLNNTITPEEHFKSFFYFLLLNYQFNQVYFTGECQTADHFSNIFSIHYQC